MLEPFITKQINSVIFSLFLNVLYKLMLAYPEVFQPFDVTNFSCMSIWVSIHKLKTYNLLVNKGKLVRAKCVRPAVST